jgi:hypothetical protein
VHLDAANRSPDQRRRQVANQRLNFGQLRHV